MHFYGVLRGMLGSPLCTVNALNMKKEIFITSTNISELKPLIVRPHESICACEQKSQLKWPFIHPFLSLICSLLHVFNFSCPYSRPSFVFSMALRPIISSTHFHFISFLHFLGGLPFSKAGFQGALLEKKNIYICNLKYNCDNK